MAHKKNVKIEIVITKSVLRLQRISHHLLREIEGPPTSVEASSVKTADRPRHHHRGVSHCGASTEQHSTAILSHRQEFEKRPRSGGNITHRLLITSVAPNRISSRDDAYYHQASKQLKLVSGCFYGWSLFLGLLLDGVLGELAGTEATRWW